MRKVVIHNHLASDSLRWSKQQVDYRDAQDMKQRCGTCKFMLNNGHCQKVEGIVRPEMVCDLWQGAGR